MIDVLNLPPAPGGERIAYGKEPPQFGELRFPKGKGPHPVIVALHGGYWRATYDLTYLTYLCQALTEAGYATWSVEYRKLGEHGGGWPGTLDDVATGAAHLTAIASKHELDLKRVITLGHSAGGQLAMWLGARHKLPGHAPPVLPLHGIVALAPVADLRRAFELNLSGGVVRELLGGDPASVPERYAYASPAEALPLGLPQVLVHGTDDDAVPYEISERYVRRAIAAGDPARLITLPGMGHFEPVTPGSAGWPAVQRAVESLLPR